MKRLFYTIIISCACLVAQAHVEAASFCSQVTPVGTYFTDTVTQAGTYYYSAWTFDLPMQVHFVPTDKSVTTPPQIWVDLTCEPGIYFDPNIQELVADTAKYGISVPMKLSGTSTWVDDHYEFDLRIGKSYRNKLKLVGVDYNVQAYVKVVYSAAGSLIMEQDTSANACLNEAKKVALETSYRVIENDTISTYLLPYKEWLNSGVDSVAISWTGAEPVSVWTHGDNCEFELNTMQCWNVWPIAANGGEYHISRQEMLRAIDSGTQDTTGLFFTKFKSTAEGSFSVRQLIPDLKGSTLLSYNTKNDIVPGELYSFPPVWGETEWQARTRRAVTMYVYTAPDAAPVDSFSFVMQGDSMRVLPLNKTDMKTLNARTSQALLFARFVCSSDFKLLPTTYVGNTCNTTATWLRSGQLIDISKKGKDDIFYVHASDWDGYPYEVTWTGTGILQCYLADACTYTLRPTNSHVIAYHAFTAAGTIYVDITDNKYAEWSMTDADGYVYFRFNHNDPGFVKVTSYAPFMQQDPAEGLLDPVYADDVNTPPGPTTDLESFGPSSPVTDPSSSASDTLSPVTKHLLPNGQIVIIRDGISYTLIGTRL